MILGELWTNKTPSPADELRVLPNELFPIPASRVFGYFTVLSCLLSVSIYSKVLSERS